MGSGLYYEPEAEGLEIVASVEWEEPDYDFDLTVVWREKATGRLLMGSDSGCSCPSPFENTHRDELEPFNLPALEERRRDLLKQVYGRPNHSGIEEFFRVVRGLAAAAP